MKRSLLFVVFLMGSFVVEASGQQSRPIPVYPGARLITEQQEEGECCDFVTSDAFEKVIGFYEKQLKTKALDAKSFAAAYPALRQNVQALEQQLPPDAKLRIFVVGEVTIGGQKAPALFEVMGSAGGVHFSIGDDALAGNDAQFAKQWRTKTGRLTEDEKMQKESDQRQAEEDKEQKERDARRAKEMPEYTSKMTAELSKFLKQNKIDLSPGLQCEDIQTYDGESSSGFTFYYASQDDFKKACDFYASRNKSGTTDNLEGSESGWGKHETAYLWRLAEFQTGSGLRLDVREVSLMKDGPKKTYVAVWVWSPDVVKALRAINEDYQSRW